ncbi:MAG TPA: alpha/beta hydrolase [Microbacterium sp.]|nr:alpha/beta hydrolase [Microbacterium sp.]
MGPVLLALARRTGTKAPAAPAGMTITTPIAPAGAGAPAVPLRVYRPSSVTGETPALLWMHGGGLVAGTAHQNEVSSIGFAQELGITVVSVDYRLAPAHRSPSALDDCHAAMLWLLENARSLGVDPARIAVGGESAGGGLAAALALLLHDRKVMTPALQLLRYPMLDDRTATRTDIDPRSMRGWSPKSNVFGWTSYLGHPPGGADVTPYEAPARREDFAGLAPAWIGVGSLDLFHDEDVEYARRLRAAGVACELDVVPGAFHGFDFVFQRTEVAQAFWRSQVDALRRALSP